MSTGVTDGAIKRLQGVLAEPVGAVSVAQLAHDLTLDLTDALTGQTEAATDLIQGARHTVVEAVTQADDVLRMSE